MFLIMREMGWSYQEYLQQPNDLLILISEFIKLENNGSK